MLPNIQQANALKRADQVICLSDHICTDNPIRIDLTKIKEPIQVINLAWVLAFCCCGNTNFSDLALNAKSESIRKKLMDMLDKYDRLVYLNPKYYDEVDLIYAATVTKTLSYELPPQLVVELLSSEPAFSKLCIGEKLNPNLQPNTHLIEVPIMPNAEDKPSNKGQVKSNTLRNALEQITRNHNASRILDREALWYMFCAEAENNPESPFGLSKKNEVVDKITKKTWDKSNAYYHLNQVIEWYRAGKLG